MNIKHPTLLTIIGICSLSTLIAETKTTDKEMTTDAKFFVKAAQGGMAEVEISQVAEKNATKQPVKDFAMMMVTDHTKANDELMALAKAKGVVLPTETDKMHKEKLSMLEGKSGAEFDTDYVKTMTMDHEKTVALFEKEATSGSDAEVKAFAKKTLPTLKAHLAKIKSI